MELTVYDECEMTLMPNGTYLSSRARHARHAYHLPVERLHNAVLDGETSRMCGMKLMIDN